MKDNGHGAANALLWVVVLVIVSASFIGWME
jgi:hypothetical protein